MTFDTAVAYGVVRRYTVHLTRTHALTALSACLFGATDAIGSRHSHVQKLPSIIQQGQPNGKTGAVVLP